MGKGKYSTIIAHIGLVCICDIPYVSYWLFDLATLDDGVDMRALTGDNLVRTINPLLIYDIEKDCNSL